jgi:aminomethyltransferase
MKDSLTMSLCTPFCSIHEKLSARMVDFAGWRMPLLYEGIIPEHLHTRAAASVFDVSHMGRLRLSGPDATRLIDQVATRRVSDQKVGVIRYGLICNPAGFPLDDILIYRTTDDWLIVCNASNRARVVEWITEHSAGYNVHMDDQTLATAMLAVQGPLARGLVDQMMPDAGVGKLSRYGFVAGSYMGMKYLISRTGYTGEDGVEVIFPGGAAALVWPFVSSLGEGRVKPAGLGARDTLRLEAAMPLYGHELDEQHDPISAGLTFSVNLDKSFIGRDALARVAAEGPKQKLVGLKLAGPRSARQGYTVLAGTTPVGLVTSAAVSPTLGCPIAMAYVDAVAAAVGTKLAIDLRGPLAEAEVVELPFYKAKK